jgi:hypothetical protein
MDYNSNYERIIRLPNCNIFPKIWDINDSLLHISKRMVNSVNGASGNWMGFESTYDETRDCRNIEGTVCRYISPCQKTVLRATCFDLLELPPAERAAAIARSAKWWKCATKQIPDPADPARARSVNNSKLTPDCIYNSSPTCSKWRSSSLVVLVPHRKKRSFWTWLPYYISIWRGVVTCAAPWLVLLTGSRNLPILSHLSSRIWLRIVAWSMKAEGEKWGED